MVLVSAIVSLLVVGGAIYLWGEAIVAAFREDDDR